MKDIVHAVVNRPGNLGFLQIIGNVGPGEHMPRTLGETSDKCIFYVINWGGFAFLVLIMWK